MTEAIDTMTEEPPALVDQDDQNIEIITGALIAAITIRSQTS